MEFKPINTQEEFDEAIKERIKRAKESARSEFNDYESIKSQLAEKTAEIEKLRNEYSLLENSKNEAEAKNKALSLEKIKLNALASYGLDYNLAERLKGNDEAEIKADAEAFSKLIKGTAPVAPLKQPEFNNEGETKYNNLLKELEL